MPLVQSRYGSGSDTVANIMPREGSGSDTVATIIQWEGVDERDILIHVFLSISISFYNNCFSL